MQTIRITTSQNIDIDYQMASLGDRIIARFIDYAIFGGIFFVAFFVLGIFTGLNNDYNSEGKNVGMFIIIGIAAIICFFYDLVCEVFFNGQTVGKKSMKIKVISLDGARPKIGQYLLRWVFRVIDGGITMGSIEIIAVIVSDKNQRVGDMVAGTTVVNLTPKATFEELVFGPTPIDYVPVYNQVAQLTDKDVVLIYDVIRNFNRTRNSGLVYRLAIKIAAYLNLSYPDTINEYQFLEIVLNDYKTLTAKSE